MCTEWGWSGKNDFFHDTLDEKNKWTWVLSADEDIEEKGDEGEKFDMDDVSIDEI